MLEIVVMWCGKVLVGKGALPDAMRQDSRPESDGWNKAWDICTYLRVVRIGPNPSCWCWEMSFHWGYFSRHQCGGVTITPRRMTGLAGWAIVLWQSSLLPVRFLILRQTTVESFLSNHLLIPSFHLVVVRSSSSSKYMYIQRDFLMC